MKKLTLAALFISGAFLMSFTEISKVSSKFFSVTNPPSIQWKTSSIDLGEIPVGKPINIEFEFTNTGKEAVIVSDAHASCGCTVAAFPKEPIAAGKTAKITAVFNAPVKGAFSKTVTVSFVNEEQKVLTFTGTVI